MNFVDNDSRPSSASSQSPIVSSAPTTPDDGVQEAIANVQRAAQADKTKTGQTHADFLEAVRQLNLVAEAPQETLMRIRFEVQMHSSPIHIPLQVAAIRLTLEIGALDALVSQDGEKITAQELAEITGYNALMIERVMRLVTWCGVCDEAGTATYVANPTTRLIVAPGGAGGLKHIYDLSFPIASKLMDYLHETKIHQFPTPPQKTAFEHTFGQNLWDHMADNPKLRKSFDDYMAARRNGIQSWYETYPIATELFPDTRADSVMLVDIGGNLGHEAASFHAARPDHPGRVILQDLESMIQTVKDNGTSEGVEPMAYNFFEEQPVKGARAYYLRSVLHDWDDPSSEKILSNTAKAMEPEYSRLLIDEYVLPDMKAPIRGSSLDFLMMMLCGGIERTKSQWESLLGRCGLEIVKIWGGRSDYEQVIEAKLKK
ncbi:uncharacterized protein KY384_002402 [Bacidia gigantensis]|uniref:uncharacterized protein n=1 Tax=Bacidia gigantensis TaxID=2732470 RepID=UPI001D05B4BF|nr:uncharacterized protein KY384_002402 [Bacidia gigantensis]KAG8532525.1 hypothetical protein KY384_002402 [Bacidia gigantensis]